jgi:ubiquinone/menaquinone biosynthesis C-methylase UbiE
LQINELEASYETYLALRTKLPSTQGLNTYYSNVHRDWCWGDEENAACADIVTTALGNITGKMLVLGAGGSRLAYDLHRHGQPDLTVALDFNPMLLLLAKRVMQGEQVELWEFPVAPKNIDDCAILRTLAAPEPIDDRFHFIIADALRAPFLPGSFDTIVTPWVTDILPEDFGVLCARINRLLTTGGRWLNFGSLSFDRQDPAQQYSLEEALHLVEQQGFATPSVREDRIPYMCSPASRHGRRETVVTFTATKQSDTKRVPRHAALPDWLVKGAEPVPLQPSFRRQAIATRVHAFVMALIDGRRSITDMAKLMEEQRLMTSDEAVPVIRSFLIKMLEQ